MNSLMSEESSNLSPIFHLYIQNMGRIYTTYKI